MMGGAALCRHRAVGPEGKKFGSNSPLDQRRQIIHVVGHAGKARWSVCMAGRSVCLG